MNKLLMSVVFVCGLMAFGAESTGLRTVIGENGEKMIRVGNKMISAQHLRDTLRRVSLKKSGGIIREKNSAKGVFVVLNAQTKVPVEELERACAVLDKEAHVQTAVKSGSSITIENVKTQIVAQGGVVGMALIEHDTMPSLVAAPESGWAVVNVNALCADKPDASLLSARVRKEVLRSYSFLTGGCYLSRTVSVMNDVSKLKDLDFLPEETLGIDIINRSVISAERYGLVPWHQATYRKACEQGWAPQPTNDFQKAIWAEIHQIPSKPITIKYDQKKGE